MEGCVRERHCLEGQFGYAPFYGRSPRSGWLLNYNVVRSELTEMSAVLYFVDEFSDNFRIRIPYYPSFLVECGDDPASTEEYFLRRYEGAIHAVEPTSRIDVAEYNHLNKPPKSFLKFYIKREADFLQIVKDLHRVPNAEEDMYRDFRAYKEDAVYRLHEHDIPTDVQVGNTLGIRCGLWYEVSYNGAEYRLVRNPRIIYPELRVLAFDIETTKPPLKFPNPENDVIMMISVMTESFGELIVNRTVVLEDVREFEYVAKEEMRSAFRISNEMSEEELLVRFIELVQCHRPHIITTYNGGFFDWPFVEKRASKYSLSIADSISVTAAHDYYDSPFVLHLDCYRWVKRDSYLPMNNQGLKDAARIKLGYFLEEIDPEDMVRFAREDPQKLASYSVSDAVATYYLYMKYVQPHIFSISSIIPLPAVQVLCRGSGTLCEALLFSESIGYNLLVPPKKRIGGLEYFRGHIVENLTYIGGHVESLRAGVFRSDFDHKFSVDGRAIDLIIDNLDELLPRDIPEEERQAARQEIVCQLDGCRGAFTQKGAIYHLDVGAMYPNIILTNRMQPIAVVNEDVCIHCDFNKAENRCKRKMAWVSRSEYLPPHKNEINMIKNQLRNETFYQWREASKGRIDSATPRGHSGSVHDAKDEAVLDPSDPVGAKVPYSSLPLHRQESILKERVSEYSKKIYKKIRKTETQLEELVICQREVPFYVETVRKFRDQRNVVKECYKRALKDYDNDPSEENKKRTVVYNGLQIAYKVVLNSFYGYVMRTGSRWFSLEMAAAVCHVGGEIIRSARELLELIGMPLELDTDGIWCCLPSNFPSTVTIGKTKVSLIANILNYFVCRKFTNDQYQILKRDGDASNEQFVPGTYEASPQNSILFEVDGPYKTMIIPSSTEENRLLKKRYVVFDHSDKIAELKGFELKRRGELNIVKKFQEDLFIHFNDGNSLQECYSSLATVCNYWLDIIYKEGGSLSDDAVFELFSESRNMSKSLEGYGDRKSNIMSTARKLSEFLGQDILEDKLRCEFIVSRYPENAPTAERCIPVLIFKHRDKDKYLKRWLGTSCTELKKIVDWGYYKRRFECILQRMVVIPAHFQNIRNPVERVEVPSWIKNVSHGKLDFKKISDIEDIGGGAKKSLTDMFYTADYRRAVHPTEPPGKGARPAGGGVAACPAPGHIPIHETTPTPEKLSITPANIKLIVAAHRQAWLDFYNCRDSLVLVRYLDGGKYVLHRLDGSAETRDFERRVYLEVNDNLHFADYEETRMYLPDSTAQSTLYIMKLNEAQSKTERYRKFFDHFSIKSSYNFVIDPLYQLLVDYEGGPLPARCAFVSSVLYQKHVVFCITSADTVFIADRRTEKNVNGRLQEIAVPGSGAGSPIVVSTLDAYRDMHLAHIQVLSCNRRDPSIREIMSCFEGHVLVQLDLVQTVQLESIESQLGRQYGLHVRMKEEYHKLLDISGLFSIPILNIDSDILELAYYKEMHKMGLLCSPSREFSQNIVKDEVVRPGYYPTYSIMVECVASSLLAIIEYSSVIGEDSLFDGVRKYEFVALREFLRKMVVASLKGNLGAKSLIERVNYWIKKGSNLISPGLREVLNILQQKYLITLVHRLRELQCKIICVSKEVVMIDTGKRDPEGCDLYFQYLKGKVAAVPGYELLNLGLIRRFEKLGFVSPTCYFFARGGKIFSLSDISLPLSFCDLYFSDSDITNDQIYALMSKVSVGQARLLLRLLSYKRDTHGLASNCYKLLRATEIDDMLEYQSSLTVFCKGCRAEILMRRRCIRCYAEVDQALLEEECLEYLHFLWRLQASGDRHCSACGAGEERRLKDYCRCGGRFVLKSYMDEIESLRAFVNTRRFDEEVDTVVRYFRAAE